MKFNSTLELEYGTALGYNEITIFFYSELFRDSNIWLPSC